MNDTAVEKLWTKDFFLIWQGQLVSTMGDAAYSVALGFWVLQKTGSTALMGTLMAVSALPGILVSPFAGVWLDRSDKKPLLIAMDILRGLSMVLIAAAAFLQTIAVWMVFAAGILLSICGAVFRPGINAVIPALVPVQKISNANSVMSAASTGSNMLGNVAGGFLYQLFGAPLMFLFNGLSYIFSGGSLCFVKFPEMGSENQRDFLTDMRDGFRYMWRQKGLRDLLMVTAVMNFFAFVAIVLLLPLFQVTETLGAGRYGVAMACFMGGAMAGFLLSSVRAAPARRRAAVFFLSTAAMSVTFVIAVNMRLFSIMIPFLILSGFFNAIVNVILLSAVQTTTPDEMRGQVLAFMNMTTQSLTPFAMALGGILAAFIPIRLIMSASFLIVSIVLMPYVFKKSFVCFLGYDGAQISFDR